MAEQRGPALMLKCRVLKVGLLREHTLRSQIVGIRDEIWLQRTREAPAIQYGSLNAAFKVETNTRDCREEATKATQGDLETQGKITSIRIFQRI